MNLPPACRPRQDAKDYCAADNPVNKALHCLLLSLSKRPEDSFERLILLPQIIHTPVGIAEAFAVSFILGNVNAILSLTFNALHYILVE